MHWVSYFLKRVPFDMAKLTGVSKSAALIGGVPVRNVGVSDWRLVHWIGAAQRPFSYQRGVGRLLQTASPYRNMLSENILSKRSFARILSTSRSGDVLNMVGKIQVELQNKQNEKKQRRKSLTDWVTDCPVWVTDC